MNYKFYIAALFLIGIIGGMFIQQTITQSILMKKCYENNKRIPCENFTADEHFCSNGLCNISGICPSYYEKLRGKTIKDCIIEETKNE